MLQEIFIRNLVLIDELKIEFGPELNVLTGETGAGKSIIMDALGLVAGERVRSDLIRDPEQKMLVEAVFMLENQEETRRILADNGLAEDDEEEALLILSREVLPGGRSLARVNGRVVSLSTLRNLAASLVDMHLQHDYLSILRPDRYAGFLDAFISQRGETLGRVGAVFARWRACRQRLEEINLNESERMQKLDLLRFQIQEIEAAGLQVGEEEGLVALNRRIRNMQSLAEGSARLYSLLYSADEGRSAYDLLSAALNTVLSLEEETFFAEMRSWLEESCYTLQETAGKISSFQRSLDFEPGLLEETEERLYLINRLKKKYGPGAKDVLDHLEQVKQEAELLENSQEESARLLQEVNELEKKYREEAAVLTTERRRAAVILQGAVKEEMTRLNMPDVGFEIQLHPADPGPRGADRVEFLFSPNPGTPPRPLGQIASGGEISRFVLALKTALAEHYEMPTLVFDEIDVGVGGAALTSMAREIAKLSRSHQVILVTHSAQVASYARVHYQIDKTVAQNRTSTSVQRLEGEERVEELARMLAGDEPSEVSLQHAREMLEERGEHIDG